MVKTILTKHKSFLKDLSALFFGNAAAQAISFLLIPLLTRLFSQKIWGEYTLILGYITVLSALAPLGLDTAILVNSNFSKKEDDIFYSSIYISFLFSLFISIFFYILSLSNINLNFNSSFLLFFLAIFFSAVNNICNQLFIKNGTTKLLSIGQFIFTTSSNLISIFFALYYSSSTNSILVSYIIAKILTSSMLIYFLKNQFTFNFKNKFYTSFKILKELKKWVIFTTSGYFVNQIAGQLNVFLFSYYIGHESVGQMSIATRIVARPMALFSLALSQSYLRQILNTDNYIESFRFYKKIVILLLTVLISIFLLSFLIPKSLFTKLLGPEWEDSGFYISWFLGIYAFNLPAAVSTQLFTILHLQKFKFYLNLINLVFMISIFYYSYYATKNLKKIFIYCSIYDMFYSCILILTGYLILKNKSKTIA